MMWPFRKKPEKSNYRAERKITLYGIRLWQDRFEGVGAVTNHIWLSTEDERDREIAHLHSIGHGGAIMFLVQKTVKITEELK